MSTAPSWCCCFGVCAVACPLTGPGWVTLSAGVSVPSQEGFKKKKILNQHLLSTRPVFTFSGSLDTCYSWAGACFFDLIWNWNYFYKSTTLVSGLPAVIMAITLGATYSVNNPLNYRQEELWVNGSFNQHFIYIVLFMHYQSQLFVCLLCGLSSGCVELRSIWSCSCWLAGVDQNKQFDFAKPMFWGFLLPVSLILVYNAVLLVVTALTTCKIDPKLRRWMR